MIYFHPNGLETSSLSEPARQLLHTAILLGLQQGDHKTHVVLAVDLLRKAGLESAEAASPVKALLIECTKALGLFDSEKVVADQDDNDVPDASCPVFQFVTLFDGEVSYRLERPIYTLTEQNLNRLIFDHLPRLAPSSSTARPGGEASQHDRARATGKSIQQPARPANDNPGKGVEVAMMQVVPQESVDLTVATQVLWKLAHQDGDLGAHYWQSVIKLLTSANEMHAELLELRHQARRKHLSSLAG